MPSASPALRAAIQLATAAAASGGSSMLESRSVHHFHEGSPFDIPDSPPPPPAKRSSSTGSAGSSPLRRSISTSSPLKKEPTSAKHAGSPFASMASTRMAVKALIGPLYPSPMCILTAAPIVAVLIGALILLIIVRVALSGRQPTSYESPTLKRIDHLSHECQFLTTLPYSPDNERHGSLEPHGLHTFLYLSAHRISPREFAVIGFTPRALRGLWFPDGSPEAQAASIIDEGLLRHPTDGCLWVSFEGPHTVKGHLHYTVPGEESNQFRYETLIIRCTLDSRTPGNAGGSLFVRIHGRDILVYKERDLRPSMNNRSISAASITRTLSPPHPLPRKATVCSYLWDQEIVESHAAEQLQYLSFVGFDSFIVYLDAPARRQNMTILSSAVPPGAFSTVTFTDLSRVSVNHRIATSNDCLYRTFFTSQWAISLSFNDYPFAPPPASLASMLASHAGEPWISFGTYEVHTQLCSLPSGHYQWIQERMMWQSTRPFCSHHADSLFEVAAAAARGAAMRAATTSTTTTTTTTTDAAASAASAGGDDGRLLLAMNGSYGTEGYGASLYSVDPKLCPGAEGKRRILFNPRLIVALREYSSAVPAGRGTHISTDTFQINTYLHLSRPGAFLCEHTIQDNEEHPVEGGMYIRSQSLSKFIEQGRKAGFLTLKYTYP